MNKIEDLLYKLYYINDQNPKRLILTIGSEVSVSNNIEPDGQDKTTTITLLYFIDINQTIKDKQTVFDTYIINDIDQFIDTLEHVREIRNEVIALFVCAHNIINSDFSVYTEKLKYLTHSLAALKRIVSDFDFEHASNDTIKDIGDANEIHIHDDNSMFASIAFNTINNLPSAITEDSVETIGQIVVDHILENINLDTEDENVVDKLISSLELKLIESLPNNTVVENIKIDRNSLLKEISNLRKRFDIGDTNNELQ